MTAAKKTKSDEPRPGDLQPGDPQVREMLLEKYTEDSYLLYSVLTILRHIPDARDGLKPVHRRTLFSMFDMGLHPGTPHKKSARIVGDVIGKYHPHGDVGVYEAMARMAQSFSLSAPLVDGQGNFGSADGDPPAAMRYTEARLSEIGEAMLTDLKAHSVVEWKPSFDGSETEPTVLPARIPNLLINGAEGTIVAMTTRFLPHNLGEVCQAVVYMAERWPKRKAITVADLMKMIPGPDLPTGAIIYRYRTNGEGPVDGITQAYETGEANLICQAKADFQDIGGGKWAIIVTELPYQVEKNAVLVKVGEGAKDRFSMISDARDESDMKGTRVVFETVRGANPQEVFDTLLAYTKLRTTLQVKARALVRDEGGKRVPRLLGIHEMLEIFIEHRLDVITRRAQYNLERAEKRLHIVEGLLKAISAIDEVIGIIKKSQTPETAKTNLMKKIGLTDVQAQAVLDMPLRRLASLERNKLEEEAKSLRAEIKDLKDILKREARRLEIVIAETREISEKHATPRRTIIVDDKEGHQARVTVSDLVVPEEPQMIVVNHDGFQRVPAKGYRDTAKPGQVASKGKGSITSRLAVEPDDTVVLVSSAGRLWRGNVGRLPEKATFADLGMERGETIVSVGRFKPGCLVIVTRGGNVKRVATSDLESRSEAAWGAVIGLEDKDEVLCASIEGDDAQVVLFTDGSADIDPRALRFSAALVNPQATPAARGMAAIKLGKSRLVSGAVMVPAKKGGQYVVILADTGWIKKVKLEDFPVQGRAGQGVLSLKPSKYVNRVVGAVIADAGSKIEVLSKSGQRLRLTLAEIAEDSRPGRGEELSKKYAGLFGGEPVAGLVVLE